MSKSMRMTEEGIKNLHEQLQVLLMDFRGVSVEARRDADTYAKMLEAYRAALETLINELTDLRNQMTSNQVFDFGRLEQALKTAHERTRTMAERLDAFNARPFREAISPVDTQAALVEALAENLKEPRLKGQEEGDDEPIPSFLTKGAGSPEQEPGRN